MDDRIHWKVAFDIGEHIVMLIILTWNSDAKAR